jgi:hypothetical protein
MSHTALSARWAVPLLNISGHRRPSFSQCQADVRTATSRLTAYVYSHLITTNKINVHYSIADS